MNYIVIELQTNGGTTAVVPPAVYTNKQEAESKFHQCQAAAAISSVEEHTVLLFDSNGKMIRPAECYEHTSEG